MCLHGITVEDAADMATFAGRVVDMEGNPVANAQIMVETIYQELGGLTNGGSRGTRRTDVDGDVGREGFQEHLQMRQQEEFWRSMRAFARAVNILQIGVALALNIHIMMYYSPNGF